MGMVPGAGSTGTRDEPGARRHGHGHDRRRTRQTIHGRELTHQLTGAHYRDLAARKGGLADPTQYLVTCSKDGSLKYLLDKAAGDTSKSLYDRNRLVYELLRYGVKVRPDVGEKRQSLVREAVNPRIVLDPIDGSLNATVVPLTTTAGNFFLTLWPSGGGQPVVSTLNFTQADTASWRRSSRKGPWFASTSETNTSSPM